MFRRFSNDFAILSIFLDAFLIALALRIAYLIRPTLDGLSIFIRDIQIVPEIPTYFYFVFPLIWVIVFLSASVYDSSKNLRVADELNSIIMSSVLAGTIIAGLLFLSFREISRVLFLSFVIIALFFLISYRLIYRLAYRKKFLRKVEEKRVLIIGAGLVGRQLEKKMQGFHTLGFKIVGFVDDNKDLIARKADVLGDLSEAVNITKNSYITDIVFALPQRAYDKVNRLVGELHSLPVRIWVIPDYFALALNQAAVLEFAGLPMIDLRAPALNEYQRMTKRLFDLMVTFPLIILATPIYALIAIAIKLDSPGPVFYHSQRVGENGRTFQMFKFRSMILDADKKLLQVTKYDKKGRMIHKNPNDPRVTRVGKLLRRTSLDELPQLINILKGDMSLVGPRPELPALVEKYEPWQRKRFSVPQGLTGWWQVNGRSDKPMHLHTEEDLYYIQHYSIWLDLQILLKTVWVVLRRKGAF
jgi:exopolysaccharide biosynthesis polyprenyl glycosylphosphotransferase